MFTDQEAIATDAAAATSLGMPGTFDSALASEFDMVTQGVGRRRMMEGVREVTQEQEGSPRASADMLEPSDL